jgi:hypothetical protein
MTHATASFRIHAYPSSKGFQIPVSVAELLGGLSSSKNDEIALTIIHQSGETIYHGVAKLTSGTEVTAVEVCDSIIPGEELWVVASKAPSISK